MEGTLNSGMCRCCASEGTFKDVSSKYHWMGEEEVYADMLRECFDITLVSAEEGQEGGICEVCITQLRNASNFKKQVQQTEEQFKKRLNDNLFKNNIIKVELAGLEEDDHHSENNDNNLSDGLSGPEYEVPIKAESEETKGKKRTRSSTARTKKPKVENAESSKSKRWDTSSVHVSSILRHLLQTDSSKANKDTSIDWTVTIKNEKGIQPLFVAPATKTPAKKTRKRINTKPSVYQTIRTKLQQHLHNIRQILLCTNATPIRNYDGIGYCCGYCHDQSPTPAGLKKHVLDEHEDADKKRFLQNTTLSILVAKLDITDFKCALCNEGLDNLEGAVNHLKTKHDKLWYDTKTNHILTFVFDNGGVSCPVCSKYYVSFKMAQEHMRMHYRNHTCDSCGTSFITERTLKQHIKRHPTGEYACTFCEKVFATFEKKRDHEKFVHIGTHERNKCPECPAKFVSYKKKLDHMVETHGREPIVFKCLACDRTFATTSRLNKHTRRDHLMERSHECHICDKKFFSVKCLRNHMLKHTGERRHKCGVCFKAYGRKSTLREHLRIHADDRRFKCEFCDQTFVQKCSLKSHLWSKHKEILTI